jgi:hypothetical protein
MNYLLYILYNYIYITREVKTPTIILIYKDK